MRWFNNDKKINACNVFLRQQIAYIDELLKLGKLLPPEFHKWKVYTRSGLVFYFKETSYEVKSFDNIIYEPKITDEYFKGKTQDTINQDWFGHYISGLDEAKGILEGFVKTNEDLGFIKGNKNYEINSAKSQDSSLWGKVASWALGFFGK